MIQLYGLNIKVGTITIPKTHWNFYFSLVYLKW